LDRPITSASPLLGNWEKLIRASCQVTTNYSIYAAPAVQRYRAGQFEIRTVDQCHSHLGQPAAGSRWGPGQCPDSPGGQPHLQRRSLAPLTDIFGNTVGRSAFGERIRSAKRPFPARVYNLELSPGRGGPPTPNRANSGPYFAHGPPRAPKRHGRGSDHPADIHPGQPGKTTVKHLHPQAVHQLGPGGPSGVSSKRQSGRHRGSPSPPPPTGRQNTTYTNTGCLYGPATGV